MSPTKHESTPPKSVFDIESALFETSSYDTSRTLFAPLHYERGYAYPLIVWLHGPYSDERQLVQIMPLISMRNYVAVAPRGTAITDGKGTRSGYAWQQTESHVRQAEQRIFDSIDEARQKFHTDPRRVFLAGFDCGGTMAFRVAMSHPSCFAGVLSLGGAFPTAAGLFRNLIQARRLPVFLAVGRDSRQFPSDEVCKNLRLFHAAGISITLRQYPCAHEMAPQMLHDLDRWIIEQITSLQRSADESDARRSCEAD